MIEIKQIIEYLNNEVIDIYGCIDNIFVSNIKPLGYEDEYTLDWVNHIKVNKQEIAENSKAKVLLCDISISYSEKIKNQGKILIYVKNPKLSIALAAEHFFITKPLPGIHPSAVIHPETAIPNSVHIGANCSIGHCKIGENTTIHPNVTIYDNVEIGANCLIHAGAVIGTDGLGCERKKDGTLIKFPHLGDVIIKNNVEIGANCQIAKGALSSTIIGEGTKINGLCFIAHNCILGKNVWITGNTMLAGTVKVGDNVNIYSGVTIREQRTIGKGAIIGMGSVVTKDIPMGETWIGSPAKKIN